MRGRGIFVPLLLLGGCIPSGGGKAPPKPATVASSPDKATLQCFADLDRENVRYRPLADRYFDHGCTAIGAVQLLEIGTPVTNLGSMTCPLARAFAEWVRQAVQPAASAWLGSRVARIESMGTYSCRSVNGQPGARLSEHGRANAVDVAAFVLADGRRVAVASGWNGPDENERRFLRAIHGAGCRRFQVVLGPDSNALHRDHLHLDLGASPYCR